MPSVASSPKGLAATSIGLLFAAWASVASAQAPCANRGLLDARYCDENGDLIADQPKDPKAWQDPATLVFSYTPVEDPAVYENVFADFMAHLMKVTGKRVRWFPAESYAAQVEAMRSGRLHIAGVATGPTPYAVNLAGFEPVAAMQREGGSIGYTLQLITWKDSPIRSLADPYPTFDGMALDTENDRGVDQYSVDFEVTTGTTNRWFNRLTVWPR